MIRGGGRVLDTALSDAARAFEEASVRARRRVTVKRKAPKLGTGLWPPNSGRELRKGIGFR